MIELAIAGLVIVAIHLACLRGLGPRLPGEDRWASSLKGAPDLPLLQLDGRHASDAAKITLALRAFSKGLFRDTFVLKS